MKTLRISVAFLSLCLPLAGHAQCESEAAAIATATALQQEVGSFKESQQASVKEVMRLFETKANELGWSKEQRASFLDDATKTAVYVYLQLGIQKEQLGIAAIQQELNQPEIRKDPVAACVTGLKMGPHFREVAVISGKQLQYLRERIQAAK
ncbi:hypothetical protein ACQ86G_15755 [Roseateles chitinivorans]|uniref:hypothetical protein n=1 Tax=Roseateles chitinivorans TaxID=2917965 RepID=UPI003D670FC1